MGSGCSKKEEEPKEVVTIDQHDYLVGDTSEFTFFNLDNDGNLLPDQEPHVLKQVQINDNFNVLVSNLGHLTKFHGIGSKCSHYGADLAKGVFRNGVIYCPWHGACFNVETGDIEEFPGLDGIPHYQCKVTEDNKVYVRVEPDAIKTRVMRPLAKCRNDSLTYIIIGAGAAGYMCAQILRQEGFDGKILMITRDKYLPYDRPKLTKAPGCDWDSIKLRGKSFFADNDIDVMIETHVEELDTQEHKVYVSGQTQYLVYDQVFIATGNTPRVYGPKIPGRDLKNIVTVHDLTQSRRIAEKAKGAKLLICGSSFIAMELASSLKDKCTEIHLIARSEAPYLQVFGSLLGKRLLRLLLEKAPNVSYHTLDEVISFEGNAAGEVIAAKTFHGLYIECDLVIQALGAVPDIGFIQNKKLIDVHPKNKTITVNQYMQTSAQYVSAGGDCCNFPLSVGGTEQVNIGHWQIALTHGKVAALNMLGQEFSVMDVVPFFWTTLCGVNIRYCGYGEGYDNMIVFGSVENLECCLFYRRSTRILAAVGIGCDPLITEIAVELGRDPEWRDKDFPECVKIRFPDPPMTGLDESEIAAIAARKSKE